MTAHDEAVKVAAEAIREHWGGSDFFVGDLATRAVAAATPILLAAERQRIAEAQEAAGRAEVEWLAKHASDDVDRARLIGAEDAWKAAARIAEAGP